MNPRTALIYLAPWGWPFLRNRSQPLAEVLASRCAVTYVDPTIKSVGGAAMHGWLRRAPAVSRLLCRHTIMLRPPSGADGVEWVKFVGLQGGGADRAPVLRDAFPGLLALGRRLLQKHARVVLLTSQPLSAEFARALPWWRVVVDLQDPWFDVYTDDEAPRDAVLDLLGRADTITANGDAIAREYATIAGRAVHSLPNGIDRLFLESPHGPPPPGRPRAVFAGNLNPRTDLALLDQVIRSNPEFDFVFAGRVQLFPEARALWEALLGLPNVTFLGARPHAEMPALYDSASALLLPYAHAGAGAMFPQKLLEYAASARPILSTLPFELTGLPAGQLVHTPDAGSMTDALRAITASAACDPAVAAACRAFAGEHLWERRADDFFRLIGLTE
jgi:glycosyltransferase involved in cell wall biosynthesis